MSLTDEDESDGVVSWLSKKTLMKSSDTCVGKYRLDLRSDSGGRFVFEMSTTCGDVGERRSIIACLCRL